jgi:hypothetical protein
MNVPVLTPEKPLVSEKPPVSFDIPDESDSGFEYPRNRSSEVKMPKEVEDLNPKED